MKRQSFNFYALSLIFALSSVSKALANEEEESSSVELKQSEIWMRLDQMESQLEKQKERINLLEERLANLSKIKQKEIPIKVSEEEKRSVLKTKTIVTAPNLLEEYKKKLEEAKNLYNLKIWHKAYLAFSEIEHEFEPSLSHGEPLYWVALCWYQMKEYKTAKSILQSFLANYKAEKLEGSARLYVAKSDLAMGHRDEAFKSLREIVKRYPAEASSELASKILNHGHEDEI